VLEEVGLRPGAQEVLFTGLDRGIEGDLDQDYQRSLPIHEALRADTLLAWSMNDAPLEPQHGAPVRLIVPGWYGMAHVKWLRSIDVLAEPFTGYQQLRAYRYSQTHEELGEPVTLMRVRSLMTPPGVPDFMTRTRLVPRGRFELRGRAWSGRSPIVHVDVSADAGASWADAEVAHRWAPTNGRPGDSNGTPRNRARLSSVVERPTPPATANQWRRSGLPAAWATTPSTGCRSLLTDFRSAQSGLRSMNFSSPGAGGFGTRFEAGA
jgi:DMSO/TMAO reductase YedYZ molybdopterin-dependent catalytic subunit